MVCVFSSGGLDRKKNEVVTIRMCSVLPPATYGTVALVLG